MQAFQSLEGAEALSAPLRARTKLAGTDEHDMENIEIDEEDDDLAKEKEKSNARRARLLAKDDRWLFVTGGFGALLTGVRLDLVIVALSCFFLSTIQIFHVFCP
jgi:hypothetical protein